MKILFFILLLMLVENSFSQNLCHCKPLVKASFQPRSEAKHLTDFTKLVQKKDTIDVTYIYHWQNLYSNDTRTISNLPFKRSSKRKHDTPEDTLYTLKAYLWYVKKEGFDCDYHIEVGTQDSVDTRIVVEVSQENKLLQEKIKKHLDSLSLYILSCTTSKASKAHFKNGLPVIIVGAGFYDAEHKPNTNHGDRHTKKYSWELHPVKDVMFLRE